MFRLKKGRFINWIIEVRWIKLLLPSFKINLWITKLWKKLYIDIHSIWDAGTSYPKIATNFPSFYQAEIFALLLWHLSWWLLLPCLRVLQIFIIFCWVVLEICDSSFLGLSKIRGPWPLMARFENCFLGSMFSKWSPKIYFTNDLLSIRSKNTMF